jgi:hypothetical protein
MNMTNKRFIKTVCPIIALFFFFATISPSIVQAQANENRGNANSLYMLKAAMAAKNGSAVLTAESRSVIKEKVIIQMESLFRKIEQSGLSKETIQNYGYILPQRFAEKITLVSDIAKTDMTTEEKAVTLISSFDYSCNDIIYVATVVYILSYFNVIPYLGYAGNVLFAAAVLCYFGLI